MQSTTQDYFTGASVRGLVASIHRVAGKSYSRKLQLTRVPIPETSWGDARLNLHSQERDAPQDLALLQKKRVRRPQSCSRLHSLESYA